eukprot:TRINITY_DN1704_c2_g1_i1.p1 TRINITY_DN1704_c2_g1~~TRINITY_DN1704_c2_g1_i1.p1  ORF type:complete len:339 (+),score=30.58 TRINITY_DN1704_c2_g1_i1:51-1067(+)
MATCIHRDLSVGVDQVSSSVLDWLKIRSCGLSDRPSVISHVAVRPKDIGKFSNKMDLYWVPGCMRVDLTGCNSYTRLGRLQVKLSQWSGNSPGWWASFLHAKGTYASLARYSHNSKSMTFFWSHPSSPSLPINIRTGVGITQHPKAPPNLHSGIAVDFPRSLTASICGDIYRRWTATISYSFQSLVTSARFAGNVATKADSVFEVAASLKISRFWDLLSPLSTLDVSWTRDGIAVGTSLYMGPQNDDCSGTASTSSSLSVTSDNSPITIGGVPVCLTLGLLWPVGQPLGDVLPEKPTPATPRVFFAIELSPWMGDNNQPNRILGDDPLDVADKAVLTR